MDDAKEEQTREIIQISKEKADVKIAPAVESVHDDSHVPKIVPPPKTANPKKKRRRIKLPVPQTSAVVESQGSREIPAAFSETSQKPPPRKRKRILQEHPTGEEKSEEWRQDVWAWKAVGQLSSYVNWIRVHQTHEVVKNSLPHNAFHNRRSLLRVPRHNCTTTKCVPSLWTLSERLPVSPSPSERYCLLLTDNKIQKAFDKLLVRQSASLQVMLSATPLPPISQLVQYSNLQKTGQSDVASFASYGSLRSINFRIAKWLIDTRKSVRLDLSQGPWPSEDLIFNSTVSRELNNQRFTKLTDLILKSVECSCAVDPEIQWNGTAVVCIRVGLGVVSDERSLIVCATADSSQSAKLIGGKLWKKVLQTTLPDSSF